MRKGLQRHSDKSFISKNQSHHAAPRTTSRYKHAHRIPLASLAKTSIIIINTYAHMDRQASSAKTSLIVRMHTQNTGAEAGRGWIKKGRGRITIQQRQCRWLDGSKGKKRQGEKNKEKGTERGGDKGRDTR